MKKYKMTEQDKLKLYQDILVKATIYCRRYQPEWIEPMDIANEIYIQFIDKKKYLKYDKTRGASFNTWACYVANNLLKNYMVRKAKYKDDTKRAVSDTMTDKTQPYFNALAKEYATDDEDID